MSAKLTAELALLSDRVEELSNALEALQTRLDSFLEPPLHVEVPPFPRLLRKMGYTPPNDDAASREARDG